MNNQNKVSDRILRKSEKIFYRSIYYKFKGKIEAIPVIKRAKGPYLYDFDKNRYLDFYMSGGNLLMGHVVPQFTKVIKGWFNRGYTSGYPYLQSNQMLANKIEQLFEGGVSNNDLMIFFNSSAEAFLGAIYLLKMMGLNRGGYITSITAEKDFKLLGIDNAEKFYSESRNQKKEDKKDKKKYDFLILKPTTPDVFNRINLLTEKNKNEDTVFISDERDFPSFYYQYDMEKWIDADIRILGNWLSSGYDFGAIILKKNKLSTFYKLDYSLLYYLNDLKFPPLYKIKGVIAYLSVLNKMGGIKAIKNLQILFMERLKNPYFLIRNGLVFINNKKVENYNEFWFKLLQHGYFMPYSFELPVFITLGYDIELIKRVSRDLNTLIPDL